MYKDQDNQIKDNIDGNGSNFNMIKNTKVLFVLLFGLVFIVKDYYFIIGLGIDNSFLHHPSTLLFFSPHIIIAGICIWLVQKQGKVRNSFVIGLLVLLFFWVLIYIGVGDLIDKTRKNSESKTLNISNIQDKLLNSDKGNPIGIIVS